MYRVVRFHLTNKVKEWSLTPGEFSHLAEMTSFLEILTQGGRENLIELLEGKITSKSFAKGQLLQRPGNDPHSAFMVKKGLLRSYVIDEKGREHIFLFAPEGWIVADVEMMEEGEVAQFYVEALEDTEVEIVDRRVIDELQLSVDLVQVETKRLLKRVGVLQRRVIMLMSASALERYEHFLETYPMIVNRVSQRMIASYLGITPEALSKIKSQRLKGK